MFDLDHLQSVTRRHFLGKGCTGVGAIALASLMQGQAQGAGGAAGSVQIDPVRPLRVRQPHFAPKAKNIIYMHMAGSPPQQELLDFKPKLVEMNGQLCPREFMDSVRFAFIKGHPSLLGTPYKFKKHGQSGVELSELLPNLATCADDIAVVRSMYTDQFNHAPAQMLLYTGSSLFGHPSMGAWITYGLGSENQDLPGFVVLISSDKTPDAGQSAWGSGYLPSVFQGVRCRSQGEPVLYVLDPKGMDRQVRRRPGPSATRRPPPASPSMKWPSACRCRCRRRRTSPANRSTSRRCMARCPALHPSPTTACWPGGWWSAACGSCSFSTGDGTSTEPAPATTS